jgi:tRNA threonylcarbamoyl adenosine modification protein YeaZ
MFSIDMAVVMPHRVVLAIETSQREGGVALRDASGVVYVEPLAALKRHDDDLIPAVERVVERAGLGPGDLEAVGVSAGPGGFTGLRIAISTAKALALALEVEVVAVPSALVAVEGVGEAEQEALGGGPVLVALAAKRGSVWVAEVVRKDGMWAIETTLGLMEAGTVAWSAARAVLADAYFPDEARVLCARAGVKVVAPVFDSAACLRVAERMLARGETVEPAKLLPVYAREPEAATLWRERRGG